VSVFQQRYCLKPFPREHAIRIGCEGASLFLTQYLILVAKTTEEIPKHLFDVIFMCKDSDGWFWAFTADQQTVLKLKTSTDGLTDLSFDYTLSHFRMASAGFINLLERTENLTVRVDDFRKETYICVDIGYRIESTRKLAKNFEKIEAAIPGVGSSSFLYLRISGHVDDPKTGHKFLPSGSLVAVFQLDQMVLAAPEERLRKMTEIRGWTEKWRQQFQTFSCVRDIVLDVSRPYQAAAATAAIMSRNMSHNLGSHALASSKFFGSVGLLDKGEGGDPEDLLKAKKADARGARSRLQAFNQYCQGRLDFIARKLSDDGDKPEPMFLVNDVLKGFMTQQVLLDTLLDDNGFNTYNIRFIIHCDEKKDEWRFLQPEGGGRHWSFSLPNPPQTIEDVLVGVTGGVTGSHALYALMENLLRNAVKYSRPDAKLGKAADLELHMEFVRSKVSGEECYRLRLWENLTHDDGDKADDEGKIAATVRQGLSQDVIDEQTGQTIKGGHGMQEMRLCAEYLAGNDSAGNAFRFPPDEDLATNGETTPHVDDRAYYDFLEKSRSRKANEHNDLIRPALRAYSTTTVPEGSGKSALVYELLLPSPMLLGLVCVRQCGESMRFGTACKPQDPCVRSFPSLSDMGKLSPHFGLIIAHDAKPATIEGTLAEVARVHAALPFRLMVVTPSEEDRKTWQRAVGNASPSPKRFYPAAPGDLQAAIDAFNPDDTTGTPILPFRRLHVICNASFFPANGTGETPPCAAVEGDTCMRLQTVSKAAWRDIVLQVYEQWIEAWKGRPEGGCPWSLMIGFERDTGHVEKRWLGPLQSCQYAKSLIDVTIGAKPDDEEIQAASLPLKDEMGNEIPYICVFKRNQDFAILKKEFFFKQQAWTSALVFDNHGHVSPEEVRNSLRFYHKFSGAELTLYQLLETPPSEPFAFGFYLLSLLEGCLTNIATLDERVADASLAGGKPAVEPKGALGLLRSSGIRALFSFDRAPSDPAQNTPEAWMSLVSRRFITPNLNQWMRQKLDNAYGKEDAQNQIRHEGIRFGQGSQVDSLCEFTKESIKIIADVEPDVPRHRMMDAIVIHEGITDSFFKNGLWHEGDYLRLYSLLPFVVRTSGRGRESRHLGQALPFIELNVLSDSCYGSLNKIKLARALLGASGVLLDKTEK